MGKKVTCKTCEKEIPAERAWTLCGRDYEYPSYFCSDSCRTMHPLKRKTNA